MPTIKSVKGKVEKVMNDVHFMALPGMKLSQGQKLHAHEGGYALLDLDGDGEIDVISKGTLCMGDLGDEEENCVSLL